MGDLSGEHCLGRLVCDQALCQVAQHIGSPIAGARVLHQANNMLTLPFWSPLPARAASYVADFNPGMHQHIEVIVL